MIMEKNIFEKYFYKWVKNGFATMDLRHKDSPWSGNTDSPVKLTLWVKQSIKRVMMTVFEI